MREIKLRKEKKKCKKQLNTVKMTRQQEKKGDRQMEQIKILDRTRQKDRDMHTEIEK